jgi:hypothetical protein
VSNSSGNDAQSGIAPSSAWKSLSKVNSTSFQPGDSVLFKRGDTWSKQGLKITSNGKPGQPITFAAYGTGDRPKFDGSYDSSTFRGVYVNRYSWIVLDSLDLYRFTKGIVIDGTSTNIIVRNSHVSYIRDECIRIKTDSNNVTIENSVIHHCGQTGNGEGVYVGTDPLQAGAVPDRTANVTIKNNEIYNTPAEAIELKAGTSNCIVQNNLIHDITVKDNGAIHTGHWVDPLIIPNHLIDSNRIYGIMGNGGHGILIRSGSIKVYNNVIYNTTRDGVHIRDVKGTKLVAQVYNNTLYKNSGGSLIILDAALVDAKNNLSWANGSGNIGYDPLFADPASGDFRLCEGTGVPSPTCSGRSPAIDTGVSVGINFTGQAPDLGAIETQNAHPSAPANLKVVAP